MSATHFVERTLFEIGFDSESVALAEQGGLDRLVGERLMATIERVFDAAAPGEERWRIEHLEVDLGTIPYAGYAQEMERRLAQRLASILGDSRSLPAAMAPIEVERVPALDLDLEALARFLASGTLPWSAEPRDGPGLARALDGVLRERPDAFAALLRRVPRRADAVRRLLQQFPAGTLPSVLRALVPERAAQLLRAHADLLGSMASAPLAAGHRPGADVLLWTVLLEEVLGTGEQTDVTRFAWRALRAVAAGTGADVRRLSVSLGVEQRRRLGLLPRGEEAPAAARTWLVALEQWLDVTGEASAPDPQRLLTLARTRASALRRLFRPPARRRRLERLAAHYSGDALAEVSRAFAARDGELSGELAALLAASWRELALTGKTGWPLVLAAVLEAPGDPALASVRRVVRALGERSPLGYQEVVQRLLQRLPSGALARERRRLRAMLERLAEERSAPAPPEHASSKAVADTSPAPLVVTEAGLARGYALYALLMARIAGAPATGVDLRAGIEELADHPYPVLRLVRRLRLGAPPWQAMAAALSGDELRALIAVLVTAAGESKVPGTPAGTGAGPARRADAGVFVQALDAGAARARHREAFYARVLAQIAAGQAIDLEVTGEGAPDRAEVASTLPVWRGEGPADFEDWRWFAVHRQLQSGELRLEALRTTLSDAEWRRLLAALALVERSVGPVPGWRRQQTGAAQPGARPEARTETDDRATPGVGTDAPRAHPVSRDAGAPIRSSEAGTGDDTAADALTRLARYLAGAQAYPAEHRPALVALLDGDAGIARRWLAMHLRTSAARARFIDLAAEELLFRAARVLRPDVSPRFHALADLLVTAALASGHGTRVARLERLKWFFLMAPRPGEQTSREDLLARRFVEFLAARIAGSGRHSARSALARQLAREAAALPSGVTEWLRAALATGPAPGEPGEQRAAADGGRFYVANAGLVLASPYLPRLFERLDLVRDGEFVSPAGAERAVHLLQFMASGASATPEPALVLNKVLCGMRVETPVAAGIELSEPEAEAIEGLLRAMIGHWKALGGTSVAGLRETFLQREGSLELVDGAWRLGVAGGPYDMLLDQLPWSIAVIRHPWMPGPVFVEWR